MKEILVIGLISLLVLNSGCVEVKDGKLNIGGISNNSQNIIDKLSNPSQNYEFQVTEVKSLRECIEKDIGKIEPCLLVNVEIRNNQSESVDFEITGKTIVTKDGKQLERYGGLFNIKQLSGQCDISSLHKLFPNARANIGMCFPSVSKGDNPILYLKVKANGKLKEHSFDLTSYIP